MIRFFKKFIKCFYFKQKFRIKTFYNNAVFNINNLNIESNNVIFNTELNGNINISNGCFINNSIIRGEVNIGKYSSINGPTTFISSKHNKIIIGNYCSIAHNVTIIEYNHNINTLSTSFLNKKIGKSFSENDTWSKGSILIGSDVWIGAGAVILSGVKIGHGAIIGANTVVTKDVPEYSIVAGNPSKIVNYRFKKNLIDKLLKIKWWEKDIKDFANIKNLISKELDEEHLEIILEKIN